MWDTTRISQAVRTHEKKQFTCSRTRLQEFIKGTYEVEQK